MEPKNSVEMEMMFSKVNEIVKAYRHEFITPEHVLLALTSQNEFIDSITEMDIDVEEIIMHLKNCLEGEERVPENVEYNLSFSVKTNEMFDRMFTILFNAEEDYVQVPHLVEAMLQLDNCFAAEMLKHYIGGSKARFMSVLITNYEDDDDGFDENDFYHFLAENLGAARHSEDRGGHGDDEDDDYEEDSGYSDYDNREEQQRSEQQQNRNQWRSLVSCVNDMVDKHNPLIGREKELARTIQVLCRKEKNNPLHIGEPGVGKTALVYGLAKLINEGNVPDRLKNCHIYMLDMGTLVAGTQFRGDFEKRIKMIMDGVSAEGNAIVYIDEIHNMVGAGQTSDGSLDASNMLKPYLEAGDIRFIGSTTYEEFNRYFSKSKGLARRFQQIDIAEPSIDETLNILKQLKGKYEKFHGVYYADTALEFAVKASAKYINDRFLPDKAIDLIDEAGAFREINKLEGQKRQTVNKNLIADILSKVCKIDAVAMKEESNDSLMTIEKRILEKIYGQDSAVKQVSMAVQMAKAGLADDTKPMASLLFVGPTGVGKTEVAKVLASELGITLVRFDMSEYTEKHTVAKLIGSPAGYVGYDDGGLLTDAIRKTPNCVLLLDEIEKAHSDIYNILLQVMDYASLTDNKGRKADFRNVILLMTSNAGAQYARQANVGFSGSVSAGEAMMKQVKKTFKPEFINRLSGIVVFNDMDSHMAKLILNKKMGELQKKLDAKNVKMTIADDALQYLLKRGFTQEYGAREIERVISSDLKPLLMKEILFGKLKKGGNAEIKLVDGKISL